jgi:hypothetical protein
MAERVSFHPLAGGGDLDPGESEVIFERCEGKFLTIGEVGFIPSLPFFRVEVSGELADR